MYVLLLTHQNGDVRPLTRPFPTEAEARSFLEGAFERTVADAHADRVATPQWIGDGFRAGFHTVTLAPAS